MTMCGRNAKPAPQHEPRPNDAVRRQHYGLGLPLGGGSLMLRLLADENLNANLVRGLRRRIEGLDLLSVQALGLTGSDDPTVLAVAAEQGRVLVTQDVQTVTRFAFERVDAGLPMPGVIEVVAGASLGAVIDDLALVVESHDQGELEGQIIYLPL